MSRPKFGSDVDSLVAQATSAVKSAENAPKIPASKIKFSPFNRGLDMNGVDALVQSMKEHGFISTISLYVLEDGTYEILSGHQRFEAWCNRLGNDTIPATLLPYEKDPLKRFRAHNDANVKTRVCDVTYYISRIELAQSLLEESGESDLPPKEFREKISALCGISTAQLYRYQGYLKAIPDLQECVRKEWLSVRTLYFAVDLSPEEQCKLYNKIQILYEGSRKALESRDEPFSISSDQIRKLVKDIREKKENPGQYMVTYSKKVSSATRTYLRALSAAKTEEEKALSLQAIQELREKLNELEKQLQET